MDKGKVYTAIRVIVTVCCIGGLIYLMRGKSSQLKDALTKADLFWLIISLLLYAACLIALSARMMVVFRTQGFNLNLKKSTHLNFIGIFFNNFLPTGAGGDIVKAVLVGRESKRMLESFISCFADRLVGMFSFVFFAVAGLFFLPSSELSGELWFGAGILITGGIILLLILLNPGIFAHLAKNLSKGYFASLQSKVERSVDSIKGLRKNRRGLYQAFFFSALAQFFWILTTYFLALSLTLKVSFGSFLLVMPVVGLASMLPSLGGLGVRELGFVFFFGGIISKEEALALSLLWLGLSYLASFLGGILYLLKVEYHCQKTVKNSVQKPDLT